MAFGVPLTHSRSGGHLQIKRRLEQGLTLRPLKNSHMGTSADASSPWRRPSPAWHPGQAHADGNHDAANGMSQAHGRPAVRTIGPSWPDSRPDSDRPRSHACNWFRRLVSDQPLTVVAISGVDTENVGELVDMPSPADGALSFVPRRRRKRRLRQPGIDPSPSPAPTSDPRLPGATPSADIDR
jgi:hypothetical protein